MKVVVLGATGHLGAYSAQRLLDEGHAVVGVGRRMSDNAFFSTLGAEYVGGTLRPCYASTFAPAQTEGLAA